MVECDTAFEAGRQVAQIATKPDASGFGKMFLEAVIKLKRTMTVAKMPQDNRWLMVHPDVIQGLDTYFLTENPAGIWLPAEGVLRNGFAGTLLGFQLLVTERCPDAANIGSDPAWRLYASIGTEAYTFANQITESEPYRPELRFGDAVKGLMVYGSKMVRPALVWSIAVKKIT